MGDSVPSPVASSPVAPSPVVDAIAPDGQAFLKALVDLYRAEDTYGVWEGKGDDVLLAPFVLDGEQRRRLPIIADPSPAVLKRIEIFYRAVGMAVERRTGIVASPILTMSSEGFGRVVLIAGRLVTLSRHLRDVHRFGFPSRERLAQEGARLVAQSVEIIEKHPDVARA